MSLMSFLGNRLFRSSRSRSSMERTATSLLRLVLVWPTTFTTRVLPYHGKTTTVKPPNYFTIHGLWPTNFSSPWPKYCSKKRKDCFKASLLTPTLKGQLDRYWPNLEQANENTQFWTKEWKKHGTCSLQRFNQFEYFSNATFFTNYLDILGEFKNVGIIPSKTNTYSYSNIVKAIKTKTHKKRPELTYFIYQSHMLLWEIYVCLNVDLTEYIPCPKSNVILPKKNVIKIPV
ncbi:ribonuclease S-7-like isoform X2 [Arachis stenosperma]|uniref:ribonuclease S-7-like isoform X2 n=1 Tax=Arachis stenosperma TaxID=217475 RepID=UPI0025ABA5DA|nr:ribonuclease S-7-like isoform X2 [Arachis stenosperma]